MALLLSPAKVKHSNALNLISIPDKVADMLRQTCNCNVKVLIRGSHTGPTRSYWRRFELARIKVKVRCLVHVRTFTSLFNVSMCYESDQCNIAPERWKRSKLGGNDLEIKGSICVPLVTDIGNCSW